MFTRTINVLRRAIQQRLFGKTTTEKNLPKISITDMERATTTSHHHETAEAEELDIQQTQDANESRTDTNESRTDANDSTLPKNAWGGPTVEME